MRELERRVKQRTSFLKLLQAASGYSLYEVLEKEEIAGLTKQVNFWFVS